MIHFQHFDQLSSTNDEAKKAYQEGRYSLPFVITTDYQTAGRGTKGRVWHSEKGVQLLFSLVLELDIALKDLDPQAVTQHAAQAVVESVTQCYGLSLSIEWPNDLILNQKKVGGILIESGTKEGRLWMVVGIGLNINNSAFPKELEAVATSLYIETGKTYDRSLLIPLLSRYLLDRFPPSRE